MPKTFLNFRDGRWGVPVLGFILSLPHAPK
jgi:hypothetical protein